MSRVVLFEGSFIDCLLEPKYRQGLAVRAEKADGSYEAVVYAYASAEPARALASEPTGRPCRVVLEWLDEADQ